MRQAIGLALTIMVLLSGCYYGTSDDLLSLPKRPRELVRLQSQVDSYLNQGAKYAPPVSGVNRQPLQTVDLDGDGVEEILVFLRVSGDKPLKVLIYKRDGDDYTPMGVIDEDGEAVDSITCTDLNRDGRLEIILGWQVGQGVLKALNVYTFHEEELKEILSTDYLAYSTFDIAARGGDDLIVVRHDAANFTGHAELYHFEGLTCQALPRVDLSKRIEAILRMKTGLLLDGAPALLIASQYEKDGLITDVLAFRNGQFLNVSLNMETAISDETMRLVRIYAADINNSGVISLPRAIPFPMLSAENQGNDFWMVFWRAYDSGGRVETLTTTFHNMEAGWYLILPERLVEKLVITRRESTTSERMAVLALQTERSLSTVELAEITTFTGDDKLQRAKADGRVILFERSDMVVSAKILGSTPQGEPGNFAPEELQAAFRLIQGDWMAGELIT